MCLERTFCISVCAHCLLHIDWASMRRVCLYILCTAPTDVSVLMRWQGTFYSWGTTVPTLLAFPHVSDAHILLSPSWSYTRSALVCQHPKEASRGLAIVYDFCQNQSISYRHFVLPHFQIFESEVVYCYSIFKSLGFVTCDASRRHKLPKPTLNLHKQLYFGIIIII